MTYVDFDPYVIRERNQQMLGEVYSLWLVEHLQANRGGVVSGQRTWLSWSGASHLLLLLMRVDSERGPYGT